MAEVLYLRCPMCYTEQRSMIQANRESFESLTMSGNSQACPKCGAPVLVSKETAFFKDT